MDQPEPVDDLQPQQARIIAAARDLIASGGIEAATTRAVATAAGVQAPTIYRLFGDKDGLLDAVAEQVMADYVAQKGQRLPDADPIADLRSGWDEHLAFALANPGIFMVIALRSGPTSPASRRGIDALRAKLRALATAGRLRLPEERALDLIHSAATGTILTLLRQPADRRDLSLADAAREAIIAAISGDAPEGADHGEKGAAMALRARLPAINGLSEGERLLLSEILDRIAAGSSS
ncbi:TetR/AcrR family transcriptional regulator [Paracoccus caeni]|uniref:TetR/AcrR family transcriptional regulator n=1 Tax=Paracoccus caeni TaxID=657651 RepID=A0A934SF81_9RHOB|nr:TetR/AcrR family transcriptional regulator [Paracoccus caeni]MBK4216295.1 TetR/AcrR family transcriptional regulator [Paracoccus caeni]